MLAVVNTIATLNKRNMVSPFAACSVVAASFPVKLTERRPDSPNAHEHGPIHGKCVERCASDCGFRRHLPVTFPTKMIGPRIQTRVEQSDKLLCLGIEGVDPR